MTTPERHTRFFLDPNKAREFETELRDRGCKDVVVVLKKNAEDLCRMASALARVEGANVIWTERKSYNET